MVHWQPPSDIEITSRQPLKICVSQTTFNSLCQELAPFLAKRHIVRKPLSVDQRVTMCLWRLGTNVEYRIISHRFGVGLATVCVAVHDVCNVLEHFTSKYINIPSGQGLRSVIDGFESKVGLSTMHRCH